MKPRINFMQVSPRAVQPLMGVNVDFERYFHRISGSQMTPIGE